MAAAARPAITSDKLAKLQLAARRELGRRSFSWFSREAWPIMEPTRPLLMSVAFTAITAALQAVGDKRIRRLGIACPPGVSKSILGVVSFPAWLELRLGGAARVMCGSYSHGFAVRDSRRCRDLILSPWYRELTGGAWKIRDDASRSDDYWFTSGGRRMIVSPGGKSMGERCTFQVIDDALAGSDVHSAPAKRDALDWIGTMLPSRLEDPENDPRVLIGQRLIVDDPMSLAIERKWKILTLPAVLEEGDEPCKLYDDNGVLVWEDTRKIGEPLWSLLGPSALEALRTDLGPTAFAAQYLQRPHDDSSSMFKRAYFERRWTVLPERFAAMTITLDASFKAGVKSDYAVIQVWGAFGGDRYLIEQWRKQAGYTDTTAALRDIRARYPFAKCLVEEAANGHAVLDTLMREMPGIIAVKPEGGKYARAATVEPIVASGAVVLPANAPWVNAFIDEMTIFSPNAKQDDQVDAMVYALRDLQVANMAKLAARW